MSFLANWAVARETDAAVLLVADMRRGGAHAAVVGTLECLTSCQRDRVVGFVMNRVRGDLSFVAEGYSLLESRTGLRCFGTMPDRDTVSLTDCDLREPRAALAHISGFSRSMCDDLDMDAIVGLLPN